MKNKTLSNNQYNLAIGLFLLYGFLMNFIFCKFGTSIFSTWNELVVLLAYIFLATVGILINKFSDNPLLSFLGYNLVVLPIGVVLSILLEDPLYQSSVVNAFITTAIFTILMIIISTIYPDFFKSIGTTLFICLIIVLAVELILLFTGLGTPQWWDFIVAIIFCGYVGYDWQQAQSLPKTLDNAIDSVLDLYLDIINIFVRLLGKSKDDD